MPGSKAPAGSSGWGFYVPQRSGRLTVTVIVRVCAAGTLSQERAYPSVTVPPARALNANVVVPPLPMTRES